MNKEIRIIEKGSGRLVVLGFTARDLLDMCVLNSLLVYPGRTMFRGDDLSCYWVCLLFTTFVVLNLLYLKRTQERIKFANRMNLRFTESLHRLVF